MFTKNDLKTGMFGIMRNGKKFVIVNDRIIYQNDGFDAIRSLDDNLSLWYTDIEKVYDKCHSFIHLNKLLSGKSATDANLVYDRKRDTHTLYNGKVVCVDLCGFNEKLYTVGKIYEFVNGQIKTNSNVDIPVTPIHSFEEWCEKSDSKWIEIKE